jgi:hypothetical protein
MISKLSSGDRAISVDIAFEETLGSSRYSSITVFKALT